MPSATPLWRAQLRGRWGRSPRPGRLGAHPRAGDRGHQGRPLQDHRRDSADRPAGGTRQARRGILARALRPVPLRPLSEQAVLAVACTGTSTSRIRFLIWDTTPTLFEWAGGLPSLTRMTRVFYEKHVPEDPLLAPLFANMSPDHPVRVARWLGEVFGGPKLYSETYGGYDRMISQHLGKALTEEKRARWMERSTSRRRRQGFRATPSFRPRSARTSNEDRGSHSKTPSLGPSPRRTCRCRVGGGVRRDARLTPVRA